MTLHQISTKKVDLENFSTRLNGRVLCGDGDSIVDMSYLYDYVLSGGSPSQVYVTKEDSVSSEVINYNKKFKKDPVDFKRSISPASLEWRIPKKYMELDLDAFLMDKLKEEIKSQDFTDAEIEKRYYHFKMEYRIWAKRELIDMLRTLIFIVDTFTDNKIIWGTGRGSSCASYILYLIGLHQVDSVEFNLEIGEFFR